MPRVRTAPRALPSQPPPRPANVGYAGTLMLPTRVPTPANVMVISHALADVLAPSVVVANRDTCNSASCVDNRPGLRLDDRLANARPACCQAAIDIDEPIYAVSRLIELGKSDAAAHHHYDHHHHHGFPKGTAARALALGTAAAAVTGVWFGCRTLVGATRTAAALGRMRHAARKRVALASATLDPLALPARQALRNDAARIRCLSMAKRLQHFTQWHGGALQIGNGACVLASVMCPWAAPLAALGMMLFCGIQAARFAFVQRRQAAVAPPPIPPRSDGMLRLGRDLYQQVQAQRQRAFYEGATAHAVYGTGAGLMTLASFVSGCGVLLWPGLVALTVGMVAVALRSKHWSDHTFTSHRDADLGTESLGSKRSMLRQLGLHASDATAGKAAARRATCRDTWLAAWWRGCVTWLGETFGFAASAGTWSHRRRVATFAVDTPTWLKQCLADLSGNRITALQQELAEVREKIGAQKNKHVHDTSARENTLALLEQWLALEQSWLATAQSAGASDVALARALLGSLTARRLEEDVIGSLYLCLDTRDQGHAWWSGRPDEEPRFNGLLWIQALEAGDAAAAALWRRLQQVMADHMAHRHPVVMRGRVDALVSHLAARMQENNGDILLFAEK